MDMIETMEHYDVMGYGGDNTKDISLKAQTYFWSLITGIGQPANVISVLVGQYRSLATNDQKYVWALSDLTESNATTI